MKPAVRLGNNHECPSTDHGAHVGGPVVEIGCDSVLIEFLASARGGDIALCRVELDVIVEGSGSVWIGGMPAARLHEACLHGGRVVQGAREVFIGGPTIAPPNIDRIIKNVKEINELRRKLEEQAERLEKLNRYLKGPPKLSPEEKIVMRLLKKLARPRIPGVPPPPPGQDDMSEEEAREAERASEEREGLVKKMLSHPLKLGRKLG